MSVGSIRAGKAFVEMMLKGDKESIQKLKKLEARIQKFGTTVRNIGLGMMGAGVGMLAPIGAALQASSKNKEAMNAMDVAFRKNAGAMQAWAASYRDAINKTIGSTELLTAMGDLKSFFNARDIGDQVGNEMVKSIIARAADIGSVRNLNFEDVMAKMTSAMSGESEPIKQMADVQKETVKEFLKSMGMKTKGMDAETKKQMEVMARFLLVMEDTEQFSDDLIRTQFELANSTRRLGSVWEDLKIEVGEALEPMAKVLLNVFVPMLEWLGNIVEKYPALAQGFAIVAVIAVALGTALFTVGIAMTMLSMMMPLLAALGPPLAAAFSAVWAAALGPVGLVVAGILAVAAAIFFLAGDGTRALTDMAASLRVTWDGIIQLLQKGELEDAWHVMILGIEIAWMELTQGLRDTFTTWTGWITEMFKNLGVFIVDTLHWILTSPVLKQAVELFEAVTGANVLGNLKGLSSTANLVNFEDVASQMNADRQKYINTLKDEQQMFLKKQVDVHEKGGMVQEKAADKMKAVVQKLAKSDALEFGTKGAFDQMFGTIEVSKQQLDEQKKTNTGINKLTEEVKKIKVGKV